VAKMPAGPPAPGAKPAPAPSPPPAPPPEAKPAPAPPPTSSAPAPAPPVVIQPTPAPAGDWSTALVDQIADAVAARISDDDEPTGTQYWWDALASQSALAAAVCRQRWQAAAAAVGQIVATHAPGATAGDMTTFLTCLTAVLQPGGAPEPPDSAPPTPPEKAS
jgi:hypothetical protein